MRELTHGQLEDEIRGPFAGHPLPGMLAVTVPIEIANLRDLDDELRAQQLAAHTGKATAALLGEKGDVLLYGGNGCADAFAALARGLACLAWASGGVTAFGQHFCADHDMCEDADREEDGRPVELVHVRGGLL